MTRFEEIKSMKERQVIDLLTSHGNCDHCNVELYEFCRNTYARCGCVSMAKKFLKQEVDNGQV